MKKYTISNEDLEQGNKFNGNLFLENSQIKFIGKNNVLYIDGDVKLVNSSFEFRGDNSIVYICGTQDTITLDVKIYNNSVFYVGKEIWINKGIKIVISEQTNVFFGNDCLISYDTCIRTGDPHLVYDCKNHERINHSKSLYVGDHVWIGQNVMLLKGTKIGSGSIIGAMSLVTGKLYKSNCIYGGNPVKKIKEDVFFIKEDCHRFLESDTINNNAYDSDEFIYINNNKKLLFDEIEEKLKVLNVDEKIKYLNEITSNCDNNRFAI